MSFTEKISRFRSVGSGPLMADRSLKMMMALFLTLVTATIGGAAFHALGWPAGWLSGAMVAVAVLSFQGRSAPIPKPVMSVVYVALGLLVGTTLSPDTIDDMARWPISIIALILLVVAVVVATSFYFRKVAGWDAATAFFSGLPGSLTVTLLVSSTTNADLVRVSFAQTVRLLFLIAVLPALVSLSGNDLPMLEANVPETWDATQLLLALAAALSGAIVFRIIRFPVPDMLGAMVGSGAVQLLGWVDASIPEVIQVPVFVVMGAMMGCKLSGFRLSEARGYASAALGGFVLTVALTALFAGIVAWGLGEPFGQMLIAFAPGGFEAMVVMSFALGIDPSFVATHHLVRFMGVSFIVPFLARWLFGARTEAVISNGIGPDKTPGPNKL